MGEQGLYDRLTGVNAIRAYNLAQHYVLEHSRFGIPMLMSSECPHGHQALDGLFAAGEPRHGRGVEPEAR